LDGVVNDELDCGTVCVIRPFEGLCEDCPMMGMHGVRLNLNGSPGTVVRRVISQLSCEDGAIDSLWEAVPFWRGPTVAPNPGKM
jgi:hypothetical protein